MTFSTLPLSYCTNVHAGRTLVDVDKALDDYTIHLRENFAAPLAAGLWLAQPVVAELLESTDRLAAFAEGLDRRGLTCHTLNAFPYGDFHGSRVKQNVYLPDWSQPERLEFTCNCARVLAALLPEGTDGSISTVPLGFKGFEHRADFIDRSIDQLIALAGCLGQLYADTGKLIRLAIEPEPFCLLETTGEAIEFFGRLWDRAAEKDADETVRRHLGLCYDVCHQAVEFEDAAASIRDLAQAGVRINKVHVTCAIQLDCPAENEEGRRALASYVEPRYLHQTTVRTRSGGILKAVDLTERLALEPEPALLEAETWRVHFHVPVDAERLGPLGTTRDELKRALAAVAKLDYAPHLEVETYTWEVMPGGPGTDLIDALTRELVATRELLGRENSIDERPARGIL